MISAIGAEGSEIRERADLVYDYVIGEVLSKEPFNFQVDRADRIASPGIITNQIIDRVINSDLVVADLTGKNPNVFYELAIRHMVKKPFVHLVSDTSDIPFDNAAVRAIPVDISNLRSVDAAKRELANQVHTAMLEGFHPESPISIALNLQDMKNSGDREQMAISSLAADIAQIRRSIDMIYLERHAGTMSTEELFGLLGPSAANSPPGFFGKLGKKGNLESHSLKDSLGHTSAPVSGLGALNLLNEKLK